MELKSDWFRIFKGIQFTYLQISTANLNFAHSSSQNSFYSAVFQTLIFLYLSYSKQRIEYSAEISPLGSRNVVTDWAAVYFG